MTVDRTRPGTIAQLHDEAGVLSVDVTTDPREESTARPAWQATARRRT